MEKKTIGIAITGSFCTFDKMTGVIKTLTASGMRVIPIFSENVQHMDTRFGKAEDFRKKICEITGEQVIDTIAKAESIGLQVCAVYGKQGIKGELMSFTVISHSQGSFVINNFKLV